MYLSFYGLREKPFGPTPDPRFLYLTPGHREALAQLVYGVQEGAGFVVLTGEVGTGKTTLVQALCRRFDSQTTVAFVVNSTLSFDELLDCALQDFGIKTTGATRSQRLIALKEFLLAKDRADERAVLILDEAQNFSVQTLEGIRLLTNFETTTRKLLQIILVGQPEFAAKLALPQLRQLRQRVSIRCRIGPLTRQETGLYIRSRLRVAGAQDAQLFSDRALKRIAAASGGVPRLVNRMCDHCLLIGYAEQHRRIDERIVEQAIVYANEDRSRSAWLSSGGRARLRRWLPAMVVIGLVGGAVLMSSDFGSNESLHHLMDLVRTARGLLVP
jgi:type II secretory pathway predicted ATPase ExeA